MLTTGNALGEAVATAQIHVLAAPQAAFTVTTPLTLGDAAVFSNSSSGSELSYSWDFGDDSPLSSEANPIHYYAEVGVYTVTLTVTNAVGVAVATADVVVEAAELPLYRVYLPLLSKGTLMTPQGAADR